MRLALCLALVVVTWLILGPWLAAVVLAVCVPVVIRTRDGRMWWSAILMRVRFRWARARGLTTQTDADHLPGVLADSELLEAGDAGVLRLGTLWSVVFDAHEVPDSTWLQLLGNDPDLVCVGLTHQCGDAVAAPVRPSLHAPAAARQTLMEVSAPGGELPASWATMTWEFSAQGGLSQQAAAERIAEKVAGLGHPALRPDHLKTLVATALGSHGVSEQWQRCGPEQAHESFNHYQHGDRVSVVWRGLSAPRNAAALLQDEQDVPLLRVARLYATDARTGLLSQSIIITATVDADDAHALATAASAVRMSARRSGLGIAPAAGAMLSTYLMGLGLGIPMPGSRP